MPVIEVRNRPVMSPKRLESRVSEPCISLRGTYAGKITDQGLLPPQVRLPSTYSSRYCCVAISNLAVCATYSFYYTPEVYGARAFVLSNVEYSANLCAFL